MTYCHLRGVKVYVAINTMIKENEIDACIQDVNFIISSCCDAIIIQDLALAKIIHDCAPKFPIHISTQAGICNVEGAKFAKSNGASRIILAREVSLANIKRIKQAVDIEIEYFVQGALCVCYSGNCYFSSIVDGNSGNRGHCMQPCRKKMTLKGDEFEVDGYNLSPHDLNMSDKIDDLINAGVTSFKIEGRLRSSEYVYFSTNLYSQALKTGKKSKSIEDNMRTSFNRGDYSTGYLEGRRSKIIFNKIQGNIGREIGLITNVSRERGFVNTSYKPTAGDGFKVVRKGIEAGGGFFSKTCRTQNDGFELIGKNIRFGDVIRITSSKSNEDFVKNLETKVSVNISYSVKMGHPIEILMWNSSITAKIISNIIPEAAKTSAITKDAFEIQLMRLGDTDFICKEISGEFQDGIFIVKSQINGLKRQVSEKFLEEFSKLDLPLDSNEVSLKKSLCTNDKLLKKVRSIIVNENNFNFNFIEEFDLVIFKPTNYAMDLIKDFACSIQKEKYLYIPNFITSADLSHIESILEKGLFDGVYVDGYNGITLAKNFNINLFLGANINIANTLIERSNLVDYKYLALSKELNSKELNKFDKNNFILSNGSFAVMTFVHCPLINAQVCNCNNCKFENVEYIDEGNRHFKLTKSKINGCLFTLLNTTDVNISNDTKHNELYDYSNYSRIETEQLLNDELKNSIAKGHYNRGVQ